MVLKKILIFVIYVRSDVLSHSVDSSQKSVAVESTLEQYFFEK